MIVAPARSAVRRTIKVSETVMVSVVHDVVSSGLRTGDRLPNEAEMMVRYGVSRASLREAMRLLEAQGLVTLKPGPGGGAFVGAVDPRNLSRTLTLYLHMAGLRYGELMDAQVVLEAMIAESAALHPDTAAKAEALAPYVDHPAEPDDDEYVHLAAGFHSTMSRFATNRTISVIARAVTHIVTMHVTSHMVIDGLREQILAEHAALGRATIAGDAPRAKQLMTEHFRSQHAYLRERWPDRMDDVVERP